MAEIDYTLGIADPAPYLDGKKLWGEDLAADQTAAWYRNEAEAYAGLGTGSANSDIYHSYGRDAAFGWSKLPGDRTFARALGIGSAYGQEFRPMAKRIERLTILEPSEKFTSTSVFGIPTEYVKPRADGSMPFEAGTFDLAVAFSCLHHVAKVSQVLSELARVLATGAHALICEPTVSMGDFTRPRSGTTPHERGLPLDWLRGQFAHNGLTIVSERPVGFTPFHRLLPRFTGGRLSVDNSPFLSRVDASLSSAFLWNYRYRRRSMWHRMAPHSAFFVLRR